MNDGALINGVVKIDHLRSREAEEGIDGNEDDANGIIVNGTSPLEIVISCNRERRSDKSFPKGGEGTVVGLMN